MKRRVLFVSLSIMIITVLQSVTLYSQWQHDAQYGFRINIPPNWSKNSYMDGTDKVYDHYSPDQNAAVQLRVFEAGPEVTLDLLVQAYEQSMLPAGAQKKGVVDHTTKNGIPGKQGSYIINYDGNEVAMGVFYTIQNNISYVVTAIIPVNMIQTKGAEVKQITQSFNIDGFAAPKASGQGKKPSGLGGLMGGTSSNARTAFGIVNIELSSRVDANDRAVNPTSNFNTKTAEIFAVVEYKGGTDKNLVVSWIYNNWNRTISSDTYNFTSKNGGMAIVSMTKPNNDWPVGNYTVKFEMDGKFLRELSFTVAEKSSGLGGIGGGSASSVNTSISGKYNFISRSDGKSLVNYHFINIKNDGTYWEEYQPKDSGGYVSESSGTWKVVGNKLNLTLPSGYVSSTYIIKGNKIIRTSDNGIVFTFRK